jgi:hypothetical protein
MAENKTKKTTVRVQDFIAAIQDEQQQNDSQQLIALMKSITKHEPKMWGSSMIGFGDHHYKYESGREGDIFKIGFAPRKTSLVIYALGGSVNQGLLEKLGKYKMGKGCLYIKRLADVDLKVLRALLEKAMKG